jgi:hypothetical protein
VVKLSCHALSVPIKVSKRLEVDVACMFGFWLRMAANTVEPERGSPDKK